MQAILDYEIAHTIPIGWINFSIARTSPSGAWQRLERGEIPLDAEFFADFQYDLRQPDLWKVFSLRNLDRAASVVGPDARLSRLPPINAESLFWEMMRVSRSPDPYMYPALKTLKASGRFLMGALSNTVIFPVGHAYNEPTEDDPRDWFDVFISSAHVGLRKPDPRIFQLAVRELDRFARGRANEMDQSLGWSEGVHSRDVVFLDDIGTNVKAARALGMKTIKVELGKTLFAVRELERIT